MKNSRLQQLFSFLDIDPNDAFTLYSIAYEYLNSKEYEKAATFFGQLKQKHPDYIGLYLHYGKTMEHLNQKDKAINIYKEGIHLLSTQNHPRALAELHQALQELHDDDWY